MVEEQGKWEIQMKTDKAKAIPASIIWDWNGTLLNDAYFTFQQTCTVLKKYGLDIPDFAYYRNHFRFPVREFLVHLGLGGSNVSVEQIASEFIALYNNRVYAVCALHDRVTDIISSISERNVAQYILSAREEELLLRDLAHYEILAYFDGVIGGREGCSHRGKQIQAKERMEEHMGCRSDVLLIGDTVHDFEVAQELGIDCILLATGQNSFERLSTGTPRTTPDWKVMDDQMLVTAVLVYLGWE